MYLEGGTFVIAYKYLLYQYILTELTREEFTLWSETGNNTEWIQKLIERLKSAYTERK